MSVGGPLSGEHSAPGEARLSTSVLVTAYSLERLPLLRRCLEGVLAAGRGDSGRGPDEIILSVDGNPELQRVATDEFAGRGVTVIAGRGRGASAARNTAVAAASNDVVVFIDDDVRPGVGWLAAIVEPLERRPGVVAVGGRIVADYEPGARPLPDELLWLVGCTYRGHRPDEGPVSRPIGSTMAFRRCALDEAGGFNSAFGPQGDKRTNSNEELALSERLRALHGPESIWYQPAAVVYHWVPRDRVGARYVVRRAAVEGASKAEIRRRYGAAAMGHDGSYVVSTLLPGVAQRVAAGPRREALTLVAVGAVTAGAYTGRRARHLARR